MKVHRRVRPGIYAFHRIPAFLSPQGCSPRLLFPFRVTRYTVKGKGVSFMENKVGWHGKAPKEEEYLQAKAELTAALMGTEV